MSGKCPWCGAAMRPWLKLPGDWRRPEAAAEYRLAWCDACRYGAMDPLPAPEEIAAFYAVADYYTHGAETAETPRASLAHRLRTRIAWWTDQGEDLDPAWIAKQVLPPPAEVCDVGCGNGELAAALQRAGYTVTGIEPDPAAREAATAQGIRVLEGTAEQLPEDLQCGRCDIVILSHVLEHCRDPLRALENARGLLRESGRIIVEVPNNDAAGLQQRGIGWYWLDVPRHLHFFTERSVRAALAAAGFEGQKTSWRGYTRQFQREWTETEMRIWRFFRKRGAVLPPAPVFMQVYRLLLHTLAAAPPQKYDSVRIVATPAAQSDRNRNRT